MLSDLYNTSAKIHLHQQNKTKAQNFASNSPTHLPELPFSGEEWRWRVTKPVLMEKFGAFVAFHFGKQLMLLLHHLLLQLLLCIIIVFTIRVRFFSLLIDPLINLPPLFLLWLSLFSLQGEGSVLILPTSSTFLVCLIVN